MALGAEKKQLSKALYAELSKMGAVYSFVGIILGCIVAYIALRIFQLLFPFGIDEPALISAGGLLVSVLYSIVIILCMMVPCCDIYEENKYH